MTIKSGTLLWKEFVGNFFDTFVNNLRLKRITNISSTSSAASSSSTAVVIFNRTVPPKEFYEVCTVSLKSILRKDIPENIKVIFDHRIKEVLTEDSNFISDFQAITMSTILLFKDHGFEVAENSELQFIQKSGFETKGAFPENFKMEADIEFSANPISSAVLTNSKTHDDVKQLFTETHKFYEKFIFWNKRNYRS